VGRRRGRFRVLVDDFDASAVSLEREERRRAYERSRLEMMRAYAELRECRRRYILNYFGEDLESERCERCDVDLTRPSTAESIQPEPSSLFAINDKVMHITLGEGIVQRVTHDTVSILFDKVGYKTLGIDIIEEQHLLEKVA
jgi:ATP-dependent DNA helicase RecQ